MKVLSKNKRISLYGNINIKVLSKKSEENVSISIEDKEVCKIGDFLYEFLKKQYKKYDYDWMDINKKTKTTKIVIDEEIINPKYCVNIYGYVEDLREIPSENGKKYNFCIKEIAMENLFEELELLYDNYICDFDTVKDGLKFVIQKIEIK